MIITRRNDFLGLDMNVFYDEAFDEWLVKGAKTKVILFRAESEKLALYGIRNLHLLSCEGLKITEEGLKY